MNNVHTFKETITTTLKSLSPVQLTNAAATISVWKKILFSMDERAEKTGQTSHKGENLFYHSKVLDRKNGILLIEVDHPGWIQVFQFSQKYIVTGFKKFAPELEIKNLSFCLKGQRAENFSLPHDEKLKKLPIDSLEEPNDRSVKPVELPEALKDVFARLMETAKNDPPD